MILRRDLSNHKFPRSTNRIMIFYDILLDFLFLAAIWESSCFRLSKSVHVHAFISTSCASPDALMTWKHKKLINRKVTHLMLWLWCPLSKVRLSKVRWNKQEINRNHITDGNFCSALESPGLLNRWLLMIADNCVICNEVSTRFSTWWIRSPVAIGRQD